MQQESLMPGHVTGSIHDMNPATSSVWREAACGGKRRGGDEEEGQLRGRTSLSINVACMYMWLSFS